jgi:hypothetical protein
MKVSRIIFVTAILLCPCAVLCQRAPSPIHSVDFANFSYHGSIGLFPTAEYPTKSFSLHNGKSGDWRQGMTLVKVVYGDVTGDRVEEAIVTLAVNTDGSAAVNHVYIYTFKRNRPKFLWGFEGGDRAWGGLRQAYSQNGELVVELFGRGTQIEGQLGSTEPVGLCCPRSFTRTRYRWRYGQFRQHGKMEILPNPTATTNCPTCLPGS